MTGRVLSRFRGGLCRFRASTGGNVATIFALSSLPLLALTGAAIDYGLATRLQIKLQAAADATALGLCQTPLTTTTAALQSQAVTASLDYMGTTSGTTVDALAVTSNPRKITLTTHIRSRTFMPQFTGVSSPLVSATSQCATPLPKTFEIALVLDNTGSMAESSGSQSKLQAVQQAASSFVDYVKTNGAFSPSSRMSIVPFAAAVAVDPVASATASWVDTKGLSSYHWTNVDRDSARALGFISRLSIFDALKRAANNANWGWAGCFDAQTYPASVQDGAPSAAATQAGYDTLYVPMFAPDEPGNGSTSYAAWTPSSPPNAATSYSFNSYLNDSNGSPNCPSTSTSFAAIEKQACKYYGLTNSSAGVQPTSYNPYTGLPNGPNFQCVSKPLQRLTGSGTVLKSLIGSLTAAGSTNIHDGLLWGWRTLSPISVFADGAAYSPANSTSPTATNKVMILMTDGTNTWPDNPYNNYNGTMYFPHGYLTNADGSTPVLTMPTAYQSPSKIATTAQQRNALDQLTLETCTNAKAAGVSIYTVGFSIPSDPIDSQGIALLSDCASSRSQAFVANDSNGLITAFGQIAASIGSLRISQ